MFQRKLKKRIQFLEEKVRGLVEENQQLQVTTNDVKLAFSSLSKVVEMYEDQMPERDSKGRFVNKKISGSDLIISNK